MDYTMNYKTFESRVSRCCCSMILLASTCVATAHATDYAHFGATTDSIRILGNTTSATTAFTREMRIRVAPGSELGHVLSEQRDAVEAKITRIGALEFKQDDIRGYTCGSVTMSPLDATFAGGWHHVAHVRDGSTARLFIDGVLMQEQTGLATCTADSSDSAMAIGRFVYGTPCCFGLPLPSFLGDLDWIRVSDVARYSTNFTPPMESTITADTSTELLLKFNEPAGTATLIDESDHQFVSGTVPVDGLCVDRDDPRVQWLAQRRFSDRRAYQRQHVGCLSFLVYSAVCAVQRRLG